MARKRKMIGEANSFIMAGFGNADRVLLGKKRKRY
jgi:hypothetical protein